MEQKKVVSTGDLGVEILFKSGCSKGNLGVEILFKSGCSKA